MSLVNDMLIALEQRDGATPEVDAREDYFQDLEPSTDRSATGLNRGLLIVALVVAWVAGFGGWRLLTAPDTQPRPLAGPVTTIGKPKESAAVTAKAKPGFSVEKKSDSKSEITPLPVTPVPVNNSNVDQHINRLLHEAELAVASNRLTDPVEDNAYSRYQTVLELDPANSRALAGITAIVERYVEFSHQTAERGESNKAHRYWDKAEVIAKQYPSIRHWLASQGKTVVPEQLIAGEKNNAGTTTLNQAAVTTTSHAGGQLRVQPSHTFKDGQISRQANTLMTKQRWREAEQLLVGTLAENQNFDKSRQTLFDLYVRQQNVAAAEAVLEQWPALSAYHRALWQARLYIELQDWQKAASELEPHLAQAQRDEEYLASLAAVYHQLEQYQQAVDQYQQLLSLNNSNSAYWLGLAVCYDALAKTSEALHAFRFARLHGGLDDNTFAYVEQRIQALAVLTNAG